MIKRIVFLCSGGGGNLRFIYECQNIGLVPYTIAGVIADRKCNAITFASLKSIPNFIIDYDESPDVENDIKKILNEMKPDVIVTTIHKILGKRLLDSFGNIFINLHYSYLPAYKGLIGMRPVDLAVKLKAAFIGTTCHFVDEDVDSGEIITQGIICLNTTEKEDFSYFPAQDTWQLSNNASYVHYTPNETIGGLSLRSLNHCDVPVVADYSSGILSEPIDVSKFSLIYGGAQKNIGPSGLGFVIVKKELLGNAQQITPNLLNYSLIHEGESMSNTPPTFAWYVAGKVFKWLKSLGGVEEIAKINIRKA